MVSIIGMFFQDGLTGSAWGDWALYEASPLRSGKMSPGFNTLPEREKFFNGCEGNIGDQPPLEFWDPLGFTKDGDVEKFVRRREVELKHGRVSMLATIGYIVPEYVKLPGELSPSQGLKFEDVPNGLGALSKVPGQGWIQIVIYCLYCEASGIGFQYFDKGEPSGVPGDLGWKPPLLTSNDPAVTKKRLNAELANGRLAMVAIIGMFFQDGLTGSAWGDWANYTYSPLRARA